MALVEEFCCGGVLVKTIAVVRKPIEKNVANNVLEHGCGGLNVEAARIKTTDSTIRTQHPQNNGGSMNDGEWKGGTTGSGNGRWPSNLILNGEAAEALDNQTRTDGVGASRFFKNVKEDLVSYLRVLITPHEGVVKVVALDIIEPTGEDESVHGFIVMGTPTQEQADELLRICKPGAHVFLIAPEEQPTGHTGMCRLEDAGFEIRDTILLLLEAGGFWYVPKPTKTEREAGTHNLAKKQQDVTRKEGHVGGDTPRNRGFKARGNSHPTVKPYAIMEALMKDATKTLPVVDPFMGSGSTGIAALHTGHDFIGIEREEDYMKISDARIRHWEQAEWRGRSVEINSDVEQLTETDEDISLSDLFGMGG